jgi:cell division protein FtsL
VLPRKLPEASIMGLERKSTGLQEVSGLSWFWFTLLLAGIACTALGVVHTTFVSRHLLNALQGLEQQRNQLQVEWGQLLLEQSSLVAQGKVEDMAVTQLDMEVPTMERVVVLKSE